MIPDTIDTSSPDDNEDACDDSALSLSGDEENTLIENAARFFAGGGGGPSGNSPGPGVGGGARGEGGGAYPRTLRRGGMILQGRRELPSSSRKSESNVSSETDAAAQGIIAGNSGSLSFSSASSAAQLRSNEFKTGSTGQSPSLGNRGFKGPADMSENGGSLPYTFHGEADYSADRESSESSNHHNSHSNRSSFASCSTFASTSGVGPTSTSSNVYNHTRAPAIQRNSPMEISHDIGTALTVTNNDTDAKLAIHNHNSKSRTRNRSENIRNFLSRNPNIAHDMNASTDDNVLGIVEKGHQRRGRSSSIRCGNPSGQVMEQKIEEEESNQGECSDDEEEDQTLNQQQNDVDKLEQQSLNGAATVTTTLSAGVGSAAGASSAPSLVSSSVSSALYSEDAGSQSQSHCQSSGLQQQVLSQSMQQPRLASGTGNRRSSFRLTANSNSTLRRKSSGNIPSITSDIKKDSASAEPFNYSKLDGPQQGHSSTIGKAQTSEKDDNDDDDEEEIKFFSSAMTEIQRLSGKGSFQQNLIGGGYSYAQGSYRSRGSLLDSESVVSSGRSGSISGKRRSHSDMAAAAEIATKYFKDSNIYDSDDDTVTAAAVGEDGFQANSISRNKNSSRRNSGKSAISTSGMHRLSIQQQESCTPSVNDSKHLEERPRKRHSSSSVPSRMNYRRFSGASVATIEQDQHSEFSYQQPNLSETALRASQALTTIAGSNASTMSAAAAAVAAASAAESMERRQSRHLEQKLDQRFQQHDHIDSHNEGIAGTQELNQKPRRQKMKRRVAFCVSSIEAEAAAAQAARMQLLMKDRYEARRVRSSEDMPQARRSLSYTSGIKMASSIISSSMPEEREASLAIDQTGQDCDLMRLSRSRMERRVLSLPDHSAITRLSQTSINEDVDFSKDPGLQGSALSASLEASATLAASSSFSRPSVASFSRPFPCILHNQDEDLSRHSRENHFTGRPDIEDIWESTFQAPACITVPTHQQHDVIFPNQHSRSSEENLAEHDNDTISNIQKKSPENEDFDDMSDSELSCDANIRAAAQAFSSQMPSPSVSASADSEVASPPQSKRRMGRRNSSLIVRLQDIDATNTPNVAQINREPRAPSDFSEHPLTREQEVVQQLDENNYHRRIKDISQTHDENYAVANELFEDNAILRQQQSLSIADPMQQGNLIHGLDVNPTQNMMDSEIMSSYISTQSTQQHDPRIITRSLDQFAMTGCNLNNSVSSDNCFDLSNSHHRTGLNMNMLTENSYYLSARLDSSHHQHGGMLVNEPLTMAAVAMTGNAFAAQSLAQTAETALISHQVSLQAERQLNDPSTVSAPFHADRLTQASEGQYQDGRQSTGSEFSGSLKGDERGFTHDDDSSFDGKTPHEVALEPRTPNEKNASRVIHKAAENDDKLIKSVIQGCKISTRLLLDNSSVEFTGDVAIHVAARRGCMMALLTILGADKDCALIRNAIGRVALHIAVEHGNFAAVSAICGRVPASAKVQCEEGHLPLHDAISSAAHHQDAPQITALLLAAFPEAATITTDEGLLPIHLAAMSGFSAGLRTLFAYNHNTIYAQENTEMMLPLDFAVDGFVNEKANSFDADQKGKHTANAIYTQQELLSVAQQHPSTTSLSTDLKSNFQACIEILLMSTLHNYPILSPRDSSDHGHSFLPLHGAVAARPLQRTWKSLLSFYGKDHCTDVDSEGRSVLQYLCTMNAGDSEIQVSMVNDLYDVNPNAFSQFGQDGLLPLHTALLDNKNSFDFVMAVLTHNKDAVCSEVGNNSNLSSYRGFLPFQIAAVSDCKLDIIFLLLKGNPPGVANGI